MKKVNIIKESKDFNRIIAKRNGKTSKYFIINIEDNNLNTTKFGITFVKKIGNAVTRNKLKRRTKAILDTNKNIYQNNKNYIIIIKKAAVDETYKKLEEDLINLFNDLKEKNNEK